MTSLEVQDYFRIFYIQTFGKCLRIGRKREGMREHKESYIYI
jgi:hypothetical protein